MKSYRLSYEARQDYFDAFDFISAYSSAAADRWERQMLQAFDHLSEWPNTGRLLPEYAPDTVRFWIAEQYLVIYDPASDPVEIIGIVHGAQDLAPLIARRVLEHEQEQDDEQ